MQDHYRLSLMLKPASDNVDAVIGRFRASGSTRDHYCFRLAFMSLSLTRVAGCAVTCMRQWMWRHGIIGTNRVRKCERISVHSVCACF